MASLHRLQWIDAEVRAGRFPNARRVAEQFEISPRQAQRDFEYMRDSLGAPLVYAAARRGYAYDGETYVLPGPYVSPSQRGVLGSLATYYARSAEQRADPVLDGMASLFARLSGRAYGVYQRAAGPAAAGTGLPFLATLSLPHAMPLPGMTGLGVPVPETLAPFYRGDEGPNRITCELHDADAFVAALLGAALPFRIEHPRWLRDRYAAKLELLRAANLGEPIAGCACGGCCDTPCRTDVGTVGSSKQE